jgi:hypothetical protein
MPQVLTTKDGKNHTLFSTREFAYLIVDYMGYDAEKYFRSLLDKVTDCHNDIAITIKEFSPIDAVDEITAILDEYEG